MWTLTRTRRLLSSRANEIDSFLDLVSFADEPSSRVASGIGDRAITEAERNVFRATVLLLLYNLMEAVCRTMVEELREEIITKKITYKSATPTIRETWIMSEWRNRREINPEKATKIISDMISATHNGRPLELSVMGFMDSLSGNINMKILHEMGDYFGFDPLPRSTLREGLDLDRVKRQRNFLGHGEKSFEQCGRDFPPTTLKDIRSAVVDTLSDVLKNVEKFVQSKGYVAR